uniref:TLC domain-containing protein n=1 Tax=Gossypium raimondii TaxID=29730 RepID=A0A0D2QI61_GOSRA|nr:hypothetical protein B456_001G066100 [Gossypium raimondii]
MGLFGLLSSVNWDSEFYPQLTDFVYLPFFALFFLSVRLFLDNFIFENLAKRLVLGKGHTLHDVQKHDNRKKLNKFKESAWKCVYFFSSELLSIYVAYGEPWLTNSKYFWEGPGKQVWPEQKIKFARVGIVTLALHEGSDVFLETAKMSKYSGLEWLASVAFVLFALSWTILRVLLFPFWIIRSTTYEVLLTLDKEKHMVDGSIYYYLFNTLLFCLLVVHIYWWILMIRVIMRQVKSGGQVDDVRSDSEGEDEHED